MIIQCSLGNDAEVLGCAPLTVAQLLSNFHAICHVSSCCPGLNLSEMHLYTYGMLDVLMDKSAAVCWICACSLGQLAEPAVLYSQL